MKNGKRKEIGNFCLFLIVLLSITVIIGCSAEILVSGSGSGSAEYTSIRADAGNLRCFFEGDHVDFSTLKVYGVSESTETELTGYVVSNPSLSIGSEILKKHLGKQTFVVTYIDNGKTQVTSFDVEVRGIDDYRMLGGGHSDGTGNYLWDKLGNKFSISDFSNIISVEFYYPEIIPSETDYDGIKTDYQTNGTLGAELGSVQGKEGYVKGYLINNQVSDDTNKKTVVIVGDRIAANENCDSLFFGKENDTLDELTTIKNISLLNTSFTTDMGAMFRDCKALKSLDLTDWDTSTVTDMNGMFRNCRSLQEIDVMDFNTSNVTDMGFMFHNCESLKTIDLSSFNTSKVNNMEQMFSVGELEWDHYNGVYIYTANTNGSKLESVILGKKFTAEECYNLRGLFAGCEKLTTLDFSNFLLFFSFNADELLRSVDNRLLILFDNYKASNMWYSWLKNSTKWSKVDSFGERNGYEDYIVYSYDNS